METARISTVEDDERRRAEVLRVIDIEKNGIQTDAEARCIVNFLFDFDRLPLPARVRVKKYVEYHLNRRFEIQYTELGGGAIGRSEHSSR